MTKEYFTKTMTNITEDFLRESFEPYPRSMRDDKFREKIEMLYDEVFYTERYFQQDRHDDK